MRVAEKEVNAPVLLDGYCANFWSSEVCGIVSKKASEKKP